jgi:hypothetical protein
VGKRCEAPNVSRRSVPHGERRPRSFIASHMCSWRSTHRSPDMARPALFLRPRLCATSNEHHELQLLSAPREGGANQYASRWSPWLRSRAIRKAQVRRSLGLGSGSFPGHHGERYRRVARCNELRFGHGHRLGGAVLVHGELVERDAVDQHELGRGGLGERVPSEKEQTARAPDEVVARQPKPSGNRCISRSDL